MPSLHQLFVSKVSQWGSEVRVNHMFFGSPVKSDVLLLVLKYWAGYDGAKLSTMLSFLRPSLVKTSYRMLDFAQ